MKKFILATFMIGFVTFPIMAEEPSDLAKKLELAKQYSAIISVKEEVEKTIDDLIIQVPADKRVILKSALERNIKVEQLQSVSEMALADVFTVKELAALVSFYATPEGKAIKEKMPNYQSRLEPILAQMIRDAVESYDRQVQ